MGDLTITLDNSDRGPSQSLGIETWLSGELSETYGFRGLARQDWLERFRGIVQRIELTITFARLTARAS